MASEMFGLPGRAWPGSRQVFRRAGTASEWVPWFKPRGCTSVTMLLVGGGGGGGGGRTGASATARGGGGGGGSGSITRVTFPASALPDILWIRVGSGGAGGNANAGGSNGDASVVSREPNVTNANLIASSGGSAGGGGAGTTTGGGAGGSIASAATIASAPYMALGCFDSLAGVPGSSGGAHTGANGTNTSAMNSHILSGGAGGGGVGTDNVDRTGGNVTGAGLIPTVSGGAAATSGGDGLSFDPFDHITPPWPFCACGGAGGGTAGAAGTAGSGGRGGIGCGGGGGAGGVTGGSGSQGGEGIVVITAV